MLRMAVWCAGIICLRAQSPAPMDPAPSQLLQDIRAREMSILNHLPNYTCIETVERSHRSSSTHAFKLLDTLRLEVALVDGKEMYGWPGAKKFENTELRDIVSGSGAIATGDFALHARAIFGGSATFDYRGTGVDGNRKWVRFDYSVALARSGFEIRTGGKHAIVAYHGSFEADPDTLDAQRIEVIADEVPQELGLKRSTDHLEYARTRIGDSDFLLPSQSELTMVDVDGGENRNHVRFSSCRQFAGESVLSFADPSPSANAPAHVEEVELPGNLGLILALADDINLSKAAIGDPIHARLQNDLKSKGHIWIAKGATVSGRITRIVQLSDFMVVGLMFDEIESPLAHAHARLTMTSVALVDHLPPSAKPIQSTRAGGEGVIPIPSGRTYLNRGLLMNWSTEP
jgi:hypothetical protein